MEVQNRIGILDSFRFIAIVLVMLYHFYCRWTFPISKTNLYLYEWDFEFLKYGYLGVEFFFIISGFVIYFTLTKTEGIYNFIKRRFSRLFPAMVLCSSLTFVVFLLFDNQNIFPNAHRLSNVVFSSTFLSPKLLESIGMSFNYIDGSYWSLWVEIQFYLVSSVLFFRNKTRFLLNFSLFALGLFFFRLLVLSNTGSSIITNFFSESTFEVAKKVIEIFNLSEYILWFLLGVLFFKLTEKKNNYLVLIFILVLSICQLYFLKVTEVRLVSLFFIFLFFVMIYTPKTLRFLENKYILNTGVVSYSLYLIHQNIGVLVLNYLQEYLVSELFVFVPIVLIFLFIFFAKISYHLFEKPITKILNTKF